VIDTGIDPTLQQSVACKSGSKDFTGEGLNDFHGHGTHISSIIDQHVKQTYIKGFFVDERAASVRKLFSTRANYCQVILKYYSKKLSSEQNVKNLVEAMREAVAQKVDFINYSGGGTWYSVQELELVKQAIKQGIKVIVAAGNDGKELGKSYIEPDGTMDVYYYYPASYNVPGIVSVGNLTNKDVRAPSSNYGKIVDVWEHGTEVESLCPGLSVCKMTGTSQATAVHTGKLIHSFIFGR
jgi:subtilisin family serine protease